MRGPLLCLSGVGELTTTWMESILTAGIGGSDEALVTAVVAVVDVVLVAVLVGVLLLFPEKRYELDMLGLIVPTKTKLTLSLPSDVM